jgi:hypothetical protein
MACSFLDLCSATIAARTASTGDVIGGNAVSRRIAAYRFPQSGMTRHRLWSPLDGRTDRIRELRPPKAEVRSSNLFGRAKFSCKIKTVDSEPAKLAACRDPWAQFWHSASEENGDGDDQKEGRAVARSGATLGLALPNANIANEKESRGMGARLNRLEQF